MLKNNMLIEFCVPVYNEEKILQNNILELLEYLEQQNFSFAWRIVIINNGSTDNTGKICNEFRHEKIKIENIEQPGKGVAIRIYGLKSNADIFVYMDVDLAVSLRDIPDLIKPVIEEDFDLVIGSRLLPESKTERSWTRSLSSKCYNFLSQIILRHNFSDLQCGFKAIKINALKRVIPNIQSNRWFFDTELIAFANRFNYKIKEIPVEWKENRYDTRKSKVNLFKESVKFFVNLVRLRNRLCKFKIMN